MFDLIIKNGKVVSGGTAAELKTIQADIAVEAGKIVEVGQLSQTEAHKVIDAQGLHVLPGLIDTQVHFRDPGLKHKEDIKHGSLGAALGGVVAYFEMPNTKPPTTNAPAIKEKLEIAQNDSYTDFAFYAGADSKNTDELKEMIKINGCCGVKIFMGSSTGPLLVHTDESVDNVIKNIDAPISIHSEDELLLRERKSIADESDGDVSKHAEWRNEETALNCTKRLLAIAEKNNKKVHVLHITTAQEIDFLKTKKDFCTFEITPQHLTLFSPDCYEKLKSLAQMNPPIRGKEHQEKLWSAIQDGSADIVGSDHAPHTLEEKAKPYPQSPSGMPGVQTIVPLMLNHCSQDRLSLHRLVELMNITPSQRFSIPNKGGIVIGKDADFTLVDLNKSHTIKNEDMASVSGWTPFNNLEVKGWPTHTIIRGHIVMENGKILTEQPIGQAVNFNHNSN